jgi:hypothetical protein
MSSLVLFLFKINYLTTAYQGNEGKGGNSGNGYK